MLTFSFLGKDSYKDFGIYVEQKPPIPLPQRNINFIEVPGRDGSYTEDDNTYKDIVIPIKCNLVGYGEADMINRIDDIKAWLSGSEGELSFSFQPDKKYIARVIDQMDITQEIMYLGSFQVNFKCRPYKYAVDVNTEIVYGNMLTRTGQALNPLQTYNFISGTVYQNNVAVHYNGDGPVAFNNPGTRASKPVITIYGSGDITLFVGDQEVQLKDITDYVTIDSELMDCYKDTELMNNKMSGDFPVLQPGDNNISWSGMVGRIEIKCNSAWI